MTYLFSKITYIYLDVHSFHNNHRSVSSQVEDVIYIFNNMIIRNHYYDISAKVGFQQKLSECIHRAVRK